MCIRDRDIYVLLHSGLQGNLRVRLEYWTSIGAEGNGIYANQKLNCITKESISLPVSYTHLDVYKRQVYSRTNSYAETFDSIYGTGPENSF